MITDTDYADDLVLPENTPTSAKAKSLQQRLDALITSWTEFMRFYDDDAISSLNGKLLKLVNQYIYLDSNISSIENYVRYMHK